MHAIWFLGNVQGSQLAVAGSLDRKSDEQSEVMLNDGENSVMLETSSGEAYAFKQGTMQRAANLGLWKAGDEQKPKKSKISSMFKRRAPKGLVMQWSGKKEGLWVLDDIDPKVCCVPPRKACDWRLKGRIPFDYSDDSNVLTVVTHTLLQDLLEIGTKLGCPR